MTPQSSFMVLAPIDPLREAELRRLLDSMNDAPGRLKPPCRSSRSTSSRRCTWRGSSWSTTRPRATSPSTGSRRAAIRSISRSSATWTATADDVLRRGRAARARGPAHALLVLQGLRGRAPISPRGCARTTSRPPPTTSTGAGAPCSRCARRRRLREALAAADPRGRPRQPAASRRARCTGELRAAVRQAPAARVASRCRPRPRRRSASSFATCCTSSRVPLLLLLASPLLLVLALVALVRLRRLEKTDPEICPRSDPARVRRAVAARGSRRHEPVHARWAA